MFFNDSLIFCLYKSSYQPLGATKFKDFMEFEMINLKKVSRSISKVFKANKAQDITFFEVKELYNLAYEQKAQARNALRQYRQISIKAQRMDEAYREQLGLVRRAA